MKKSIYLILILTVMVLTGCAKKDQMTNFIPTQSPEEESDAVTDDSTSNDNTSDEKDKVTTTPKEVHVGKTTPMYVKLDKYGAYLNVRSTPSTDGEQVGFLVHGEKVDVIEIANGWASILYDKAVCYVNADFLVDKQPEYLDPPSPTPTPIATPKQKAGAAKPEI